MVTKATVGPGLGSTLTCCVTQASPQPFLSFVFFSWKIDWACLQAYERINSNEHKGSLHPLEMCTQTCTYVHIHMHTCTHSWWYWVTGIPVVHGPKSTPHQPAIPGGVSGAWH